MNGISNGAGARAYRNILLYVDDRLLNGAPHHPRRIETSGIGRALTSSSVAQLHAALCEYASGRDGLTNCLAGAPLQRRFEVMAQTTPCAIAVTFAGRRLTYGELDHQADALALHLQAGGLIPGSFCVIDLEPSLAQVRTILAVLKAGAACLLLDPEVAESVAAAALTVLRPAILFTRGSERRREATGEMRMICCDEDATDLPHGWPDEKPIGARTPAYAFATASNGGDLCIFVRTHHALGACLDTAIGTRPEPAGADLVVLWRALSSGAALTIQARH